MFSKKIKLLSMLSLLIASSAFARCPVGTPCGNRGSNANDNQWNTYSNEYNQPYYGAGHDSDYYVDHSYMNYEQPAYGYHDDHYGHNHYGYQPQNYGYNQHHHDDQYMNQWGHPVHNDYHNMHDPMNQNWNNDNRNQNWNNDARMNNGMNNDARMNNGMNNDARMNSGMNNDARMNNGMNNGMRNDVRAMPQQKQDGTVGMNDANTNWSNHQAMHNQDPNRANAADRNNVPQPGNASPMSENHPAKTPAGS